MVHFSGGNNDSNPGISHRGATPLQNGVSCSEEVSSAALNAPCLELASSDCGSGLLQVPQISASSQYPSLSSLSNLNVFNVHSATQNFTTLGAFKGSRFADCPKALFSLHRPFF